MAKKEVKQQAEGGNEEETEKILDCRITDEMQKELEEKGQVTVVKEGGTITITIRRVKGRTPEGEKPEEVGSE